MTVSDAPFQQRAVVVDTYIQPLRRCLKVLTARGCDDPVFGTRAGYAGHDSENVFGVRTDIWSGVGRDVGWAAAE